MNQHGCTRRGAVFRPRHAMLVLACAAKPRPNGEHGCGRASGDCQQSASSSGESRLRRRSTFARR